MNSSPIKKLFDYINFFSKNMCFADPAKLCSKSEGILSSVLYFKMVTFSSDLKSAMKKLRLSREGSRMKKNKTENAIHTSKAIYF